VLVVVVEGFTTVRAKEITVRVALAVAEQALKISLQLALATLAAVAAVEVIWELVDKTVVLE
jgi:hypothetical protein